ncbi:NLI interacting factor phosphatase [uncultured virus]|nr:NLI interacting factor phosphatase [uncultured virus]
MHIILDIDGTLISEDTPSTLARPHLHEFLKFCFEKFETVSIWSAAGEDHVKCVSEAILPEGKNWLFVKHSKHCHCRYTGGFGGYPLIITQKRLWKVWRSKKYRNLGIKKENTLIIDNTPKVCVKNYGNAIYVQTFRGEDSDDELLKLMEYLTAVLYCQNVRKLEKRGWRSIVEGKLRSYRPFEKSYCIYCENTGSCLACH